MPKGIKRRASDISSRSRSRSSSRSRSVTPKPGPSHSTGSGTEREMERETSPKLWQPPPPALEVNETPETSAVDVFQIPRGTVKKKKSLPPKRALQESIHIALAERVAELALEHEEGEEAFQTNREHILKWIRKCETLECPDRAASPSSTPVVPPVATTSASRTTSVQPEAGPSGTQRPVVVAPGDTHRRAGGIGHEGSEYDSEFDDEFDNDLDVFAASAAAKRDIPADDELEDDDRNAVNIASRVIDEAVELMVDVPTDFTWDDNFDTFRGQPEEFSGPTPGPIDDYDTPYEAFTSIWSRDFMEHIVKETNRYAEQTIEELKAAGKWTSSCRLYRWTDTSVDEMYVYFALNMYMGINMRTVQHEYWKTKGHMQLPNFRRLMSFNRFILLNKCIHFVDNSDVSQNFPHNENIVLSAKSAKLAPVIIHLNSKFSKLYNLQQDIAIDESLTLFKGRLSWAQMIRSKAARFGIKSFELCESRTGYMWRFHIYTGKNSDRGDTAAPSVDLAHKSTQMVLDLLKGLEHRGHLVTMDNFYNCPALARYLKSLGFDNLGTLRPNRKHVPVEIAKAPKDVQKGTIIARHSGDVSCLAWKDSKLVYMISTYHKNETFTSRKAGRDLVKPVAVRDYNSTMGGVDLKDQKLSMYLLERKRCLKWYIKMFKRLLNVSVLNAFIMLSCSLRRRGKSSMAHRSFREQLAESLVEKHLRCPPSIQGIPATAPKEQRLQKHLDHFPIVHHSNNRKYCHVCLRNDKRKYTNLQCEACDEFMCQKECWRTWHTSIDLPGRDVNKRSRLRK